MPLPKIEHPINTIKVPSLNKSFKFRPFLVKEEKLLLMAKESKKPYDILIAIKQVVNNCCLDEELNIDKITLFDLEYIFLKLRSNSVDNIITVSYRDKEDKQLYNFEIDLNDIEIEIPDNVSNVVKISETSGMLLRYPPATLYDDEDFLSLEEDHLFEMIIRCIDKIYEDEEVFEADDIEKQELSEYLDQLGLKEFQQIKQFLVKTPSIRKELSYVNKNNRNRKIVLRSLNDFFTWR